MSKIALLLSGQLRSFEKGYEYISKNLLTFHDVDVYFHTWSKNWNPLVLSLYNPIMYLVEDQSAFSVSKEYKIASPNHPAINTFGMYRSIMMSNLLRIASGRKYDWLVRTRFDFALNTSLDFTNMRDGRMYYCNTRSNSEHTAVHDQFVVAQSNNMDEYCSLYDNIDCYHKEGCVVNGEDLLEWHLRKKGLVGNNIVSYLDLKPPFMHGRYNWGKHSLIRDDMERWTQCS